MSDDRNETQQPGDGPEVARAGAEDTAASQIQDAAVKVQGVAVEGETAPQPDCLASPVPPAPPQAPFPYGVPSASADAAGPVVPPPVPGAGACGAAPSMPPQPPRASASVSPSISGKAVGALVCGILAILTCETVLLGIALGIAAIVLAGSVAKEGIGDGKAVAGRICGIIGLVLSTLTLLMYLVLAAVGIAWFDHWEVYYGADEWHQAVQEILDGEVDVDFHDGHAYVHIGKDSVEVQTR